MRRRQSAQTLTNLGYAYYLRAEYAEATDCFAQALEMYKVLVPPGSLLPGYRGPVSREHIERAKTLNSLALVEQADGELVRALELFRESLAWRERAYPKEQFPDGHEDVAQALQNLGAITRPCGHDVR